MNKKALFSLSLFMLFFVSSCKNFFGGKEIMNQIEDSLDFLSAPYIKVNISADNQATQAISPAVGSYTDKYKNTSEIVLSFEETKNYQFTNWVVEPKGAVDFKDEEAKSTTAILNTKAKQVTIYPQVYKRPTFEISPSNVVVSPKNTSIVISFDHKMEISDEQLHSIDIQISNLSVKDLFEYQITEISGKTVVTCKPLISAIDTLEASTVNVIVPAGFYFLTPDKQKISTNEETIYAYKINNETIEKANITVASTEGTLSYSGTNDYSLGNEITVSFTPSIEYEIDHWEAFYTNTPDIAVSPSIILLVPSEEDIYTVTAKLLTGSNEPFILKPVCVDRNYIQASFITEHGYISPSEPKKIYTGQSLSLSYRQDTDYAFLNWEVLNADNIPVTYEEYKDIFDFDNSNIETEITVKDIQDKYTYKFFAKCAERAQILSTTPLYSADGTYRDTRIQVMFDHDMSEDSIYYSSDEINNIISETGNTITIDDFLHVGEDENNYKYYGYKKDDEIIYKNISIINYKTKKNILENFDPPYFESKTVLVIPTNNIKPPAAGTQVFVTIDSGFFFLQDSTPIYLASSKKWNYLVNTRIDTNPPELTVVSFKKTLIDDTHKVFDTTSITNNEPEPFGDNDSKSQNFTKADKLELALKLEDLGSGPASISMDIINISNKTRIENINIPIEIYGTEGFYGQYSDSDLLGIPLNLFDYVDDSSDINGTIAIRFKGTDIKNNPKYSDYYVFYSDTIPPQLPNKPEISSNENKINISWENPSDSDFDKVIIEYMEKGSSDKTTIDSLNSTNTFEELSLNNGITYDVSLYPIDKFGNVGTVYSRTISTMPGTPEITTQLESSQLVNSVTLHWNKPEGNYSKAKLYCYKLVNSTPTLLSSYETESPDETSYTFTNLPYGEMCSFSIYAYDSENQRSTESANINTFVLPEPATSVTAETISVSQIKVSWTNPTTTNSSYTGYKLYYKPKSAEDWSSITLSSIFSSYTVSGLKMGTDYDFELKRYATFQTTRTFESTGVTTSAATKAGSVYNLKADSITTDSINLSWENIAAENYDTILIEYKASSDANYESITLEKGTESYLYEDLTAGSTYIFNVYAVRSNAKGISSTYICDTKPNPITNLQYDSTYTKTTSSFRVKWTNPTSGKTNGTKIYYSTLDETPNDSTPYIVASKTSSFITLTGLTAGTKYYLKAVSLSEAQEEESTISSTEAATKTATVTNLSTSQTLNGNSRNISLSWTAPSGNYTGFTVYYGTTNPPTLHTTVSTNSCSLETLAAGQRYYIYVRTNNSSTSEYVDSTPTTFITTPNKVTSLSSTPISTSKIKLSWTNPSSGSIEGIRIYRKTGSGTYEKLTDVTNVTNESTDYEDSYSLTAGTTYTYKVVPYVTNGTTTIENTDLVTTTNAPKPNPVTNLKAATTTTTSEAKISWNYPTNGSYTGAIVYYKLSKATSYTKYTTVSKSYSYSYISNLTPGQKYYFKVVTYSNNDQTNVSSDTTSSILALYPNSVTNLSASETSNSVKLTWTKPSGYILSYNIYKKTYSGSYSFVGNCNNTDTSYTVTGLNSGTKYTFKVVTLGEGTQEAIAEVSRNTKPAAPTNVSVYCDDGQGRIKLKWTQPSGDAFDDVDVYVGTSKVGTVTTSTATAGSTTYLFVDIPNFSRSSSYSFTLKPYIKQVDGNYGIGDVYTLSGYYNSTGDLKINGTTYSYTRLKNVITSQTSINANTTLTDGAFTKNRYITLSPYSIGAFEVTNQLYYVITGSKPSSSHSNETWYEYYPVEKINWYQACWFCNKLSNIMGLTPVYKLSDGTDISTISYSGVPLDTTTTWSQMTYNMSANGYRLPTEAEWEFAARGGETSYSSWSYKYAGSNDRDTVAWSNSNANGKTHTVGVKSPNRLGLYDMSGNVWEWLTDWNNNVPNGTFTDPVISYSSSYKSENEILQKGGSWKNDTDCMVDYNSTHETPGTEDDRTGFRIMRRKTCSN